MKSFRTIAAALAASLIWLACAVAPAQAQVVQSLSNLISVSRATPATTYCVNSAGGMQSFAANTARVCSGTGLLVEPAATNFFWPSQGAFNGVNFTKQNVTIADNTVVAPDGTTTASVVTDDSANSNHSFFGLNVFAFTSGSTYTLSTHVKAGTSTLAQMTLPGTAFTGLGYANFDLTTCSSVATGGTGVVASGGIQLANGWCRIWIAQTATASVSQSPSVVVMINSTSAARAQAYVGTGSNIQIWGTQTELTSLSAPAPTSYIPAAGGSVTRSADTITAVANSILERSLNSQQGSVLATINAYAIPTPMRVFSTNADALGMYSTASPSASNPGIIYSTAAAATTTNSFGAGSSARIGINWGSGTQASVLNGGTLVSGAVGGSFATGTVYIGNRSAGDRPLYGYIQRLTAYVTKLSNSDLTTASGLSASLPTGYTLDLNFATGTYLSAGALLLANTPPPSISMDFANNYYTQSVWQMSDVISVTRAQTVTSYCPTLAGVLIGFAADTLRQTDAGACIEGTATNSFLQATWPGGGATPTGWSQSGAGGTAVTSNYGTGASAYTLTSAGTANSFNQSIVLAAATTYTVSVLVEANPNNATAQQILDVGSIPSGGSITWWPAGATGIPTAGQRVYFTWTSGAGGSVQHRIGLQNGAVGSITLSRPQFEAGSAPSTFIPSGASAATRNGDNVQLIGAALAAATAPRASIIQAQGPSSVVSTFPYAMGNSLGTRYMSVAGATFVQFRNAAVQTITGVLSSGSFSASDTKVGIAWDDAGRSVVVNAGAVVSDANPNSPPPATMAIGWNGNGAGYWGGQIYRTTIYASRFADAALQSGTNPATANPPPGWAFDINYKTGTVRGIAQRSLTDFFSITNSTGGYVADLSGALTWKYGPVTNLLTTPQGGYNGANWFRTNVFAADNTTLAPDGTTTASTITDSATNAAHNFVQTGTTIPVTLGNPYIGSLIAAPGTTGLVQVTLISTAFTGLGYVNIDLATCTVVGSGGTSNGFGAYRYPASAGGSANFCRGWIDANATATTTTSGLVICRINSAADTRCPAYVGVSTTIIAWGSQFEPRPYPTAIGPAPYVNGTSPAEFRRSNQGLLVEEARTNLIQWSQAFDNAAWGTFGLTVTADQAVAPDGTLTADLFNAGVANSTHGIASALFSTSNGTNYTASAMVRPGTGRYFQLWFSSVGFGGSVHANFDLLTGTVGSVGLSVTGTSIRALANGYWLISVTAPATATVTNSASANLAVANSSAAGRNPSFTGASETFYVWGAQMQSGVAALSYCPTAGAAATCSADVIASTGAMSAMLNSAIVSMYMQAGPTPAAAIFSLNSPNGSTTSYLGRSTSNNAISARAGGGSIASAALSGAWTTGSHKFCATSDGASIGIAADGSAVGTQSGVLGVSAPNYFGSRGSTEFFNGYIQKINMWNIALGTRCQPVSLNYLLKRDLDPASNDNTPMFQNRAA